MTAAAEKDAIERLRKFVVERRHHKQLRQQDLVELGGVSKGWVGMLEAGKLKSPPRDETLQKVVAGLLLPGEHRGSLFNFLELVMAGSVDGHVTRQVAMGKKTLPEVMQDLIEGRGVSVAEGVQDAAPALFFDRKLRSQRLETILNWLREDLSAEQQDVASRLLRLFYFGEGAENEPESARSAPRRRTHAPK